MSGTVVHLSEQGTSGGTGTGWSGEVDTFAELPPFGDHINEVYLVLNGTGSQWTFNLKRSGFYIADVSQWRKLSNAQFLFNDNEFTVKNSVDQTKQMHLNVSAVTAGTQRTLTVPNKNGTIALLDDIPAPFFLTGVASSFTPAAGEGYQNINYNNGYGVVIAGFEQGNYNRVGVFLGNISFPINQTARLRFGIYDLNFDLLYESSVLLTDADTSGFLNLPFPDFENLISDGKYIVVGANDNVGGGNPIPALRINWNQANNKDLAFSFNLPNGAGLPANIDLIRNATNEVFYSVYYYKAP